MVGGFLPSRFQGVQLRGKGDPVLYLGNPAGISRDSRRPWSRPINQINTRYDALVHDPEIATRITQYEMAFRMQASVPELMDASKEPQARPGALRLQAGRRLVCVQLPAGPAAGRARRAVHPAVPQGLGPSRRREGGRRSSRPQEIDRACAALIRDLKQRGMLEDTLIVWAGEFGRTPMSQGGDGRDHHNKGFTVWLAGGGVHGGLSYGATDELGYAAVENVATVHDLHATMLHLLGIDARAPSAVKFQGLDARLIGVEPCQVLQGILA